MVASTHTEMLSRKQSGWKSSKFMLIQLQIQKMTVLVQPVSWKSAEKAILYSYEAGVILDTGKRGHHHRSAGIGSLVKSRRLFH